MTVGLPGTGIGGIFYFLLAALMPLDELRLTLLGRSGVKRWATVMLILFLSAGMLATLWGEAWLIKKVFLAHGTGIASRGNLAIVTPAVAAAPFIVLGLLIVGVHATRLILQLWRLSGAAVRALA